MPLYEYQCPQCGRFELIQKFSDRPLTDCPTCGREVSKLLSAPAIQFKGTGWYVTDYARKSTGGDGASADAPSSDAASSKDAASSTPQAATSPNAAAAGSSPSK